MSLKVEMSEHDGMDGLYQVLKVVRDGEVIYEEADCGEPEDQTFGRNWWWVKGAIEYAYKAGLEDGIADLGGDE